MGNICSCLCPKRRKNTKTSYDVHEETFEMEENIDSMNIDDNSPTIPKDVNLTDEIDHEERQSTESLIQKSNQAEHEKITNKEEKKYIETKMSSSKKDFSQESVSFKNQIDEINSDKNIGSAKDLVSKEERREEQLSANKIGSGNQLEKVPVQPVQEEVPEPPKVQQKKSNPNILKPKTVKKKYNPDDYQFKGEDGQFKVKKIDSIKCQQYNIDNCKNSEYFIFDITANVYIDDTNDCKIFIAPCESSIFVRNCRNLTIIAATTQFRTYECHNCVFSLLCKSQPVIESSSDLVFTPIEIKSYAEFTKQMTKTKLDLWNNHWSEIHNFTKKVGETHHTLKRSLPEENYLNWQKGFMEAEIEGNGEFESAFIQGLLPFQIDNYEKCIMVFNKDVSNDDSTILQAIRGYRVLKAFKGKLAGFGKQDRVALLLAYTNGLENQQTLKNLGEVFTSQEKVSQYEGQFFVSFSDEREK